MKFYWNKFVDWVNNPAEMFCLGLIFIILGPPTIMFGLIPPSILSALGILVWVYGLYLVISRERAIEQRLAKSKKEK